ncbi:conserved hypothetical protein [Shewanella denitrificans OS217]|jgi:hypothetical protein|uniref:Uncharacterized protein n=1 Tax=Shewanella denitrificans (strain OS217 / ATCC BAA-1090 / DSM 15013) TaxID=318161 RepID=Q12MH0_SHEDO|nr:hypothetical protein [Shewanella denitrificans]ABE55356.1 conserved hypothetical protein [Shewanella denitrificans OS217]
MSNLTKEEVIAQLQLALEKQSSEKIEIVQKGSWYKINEGKSLRFSDLEQMLADVTSGREVQAPAKKTTTTKPAKPATTSASKAPTKQPVASTKAAGLTPKQVWREKLANAGGQTLPRGF